PTEGSGSGDGSRRSPGGAPYDSRKPQRRRQGLRALSPGDEGHEPSVPTPFGYDQPSAARNRTGHEVTRDDTTRPVSARPGENGSSGWPIRRIQGIDSGFVLEDQAQERSSTSEDAGNAADHSGGYRSVLEIVKVAHQVDGDERGEEEAEGREAEQPNPDAAPFRSGLTGDNHGGCLPARWLVLVGRPGGGHLARDSLFETIVLVLLFGEGRG